MTSFASPVRNRQEEAKTMMKKRQVCSWPTPNPWCTANICKVPLRLQFVQPEPKPSSLLVVYLDASISYVQTGGYIHFAECVCSTCGHIQPTRLQPLLCFKNRVHTLYFFFPFFGGRKEYKGGKCGGLNEILANIKYYQV